MSRETLEDYVSKKMRDNRDFYRVLRETYNRVSRGELVIEDPDPPSRFIDYVKRLDYSLWMWTVLILTILTIVLVYTTSYINVLTPLRYVLGTLYVLLLPGYSIVEALYPGERDLRPLERVALSIGLSLAVVPLVGLILNYTPWGIRLEPVVFSLAMLIISMTLTASYRKYILLKLVVLANRR
ncbi:MAG: DUF1616 domain-containing protein [Sulfolobales archaeon]